MLLRKISILLLISIVSFSLVGCQGQDKQDRPLRYSLGAEPETLDPRKMTGTPEAVTAMQLFEGLTSLDPQGQPVAATAESWTISADGLVYTFTIRNGAKWSNGDPVTAQDFEYAWKKTLSPEFGSKYAYQLFYLKNGEAYNQGKVQQEDVGVKTLNERTLEVTLQQPTPYFLALAAFHTLYPVHQKTVKNNERWSSDPATLISNGPFKLTTWQHNSKLEMAKNEHYWDSVKVKLAKLEFIITESANTELAMFDNGQLDMGGNPPLPEFDRLKKEGKLRSGPLLATYYYSFNTTKPPFQDARVRKAFSLAIDRTAIINNILKGGQNPAMAWVPLGTPDAMQSSDFRKVGGDYFVDGDIALAKKILAEAGYPEGKGLPSIQLLYNTSENHKAIAEAIQEGWKKNLGAKVELTNQEWKVFLKTKKGGDYQIARDGWVGDYVDPMTFMDMFVTGGGNNDGRYSNREYDNMIQAAQNTSDNAKRMTILHKAESVLMDDMAILPIYFYTKNTMIKPYVKGVKFSVLEIVSFKEAYLDK